MKQIYSLIVILSLTGCYTSNQMIISGNQSGQKSKTPQTSSFSTNSKRPATNSSGNKSANINTQTTNLYFSTNSVNTNSIQTTNTTITNKTSNSSPSVQDVTIEESILVDRYYIIQ
jgi:hypothetical protein